MPVDRLWTTMLALGTTAPDGSVTVPERLAVDWADASRAAGSASSRRNSESLILDRSINERPPKIKLQEFLCGGIRHGNAPCVRQRDRRTGEIPLLSYW